MTTLKFARVDAGLPTRYVATDADGTAYTINQRTRSGIFACTSYAAWAQRPGAARQELDGSPFGRLRDAKAACEKHAQKTS